ncbi:MAG TPA: hypothetical protein VEI49_09430 [Terriglobales bacterium]|nr:hypothetical protein [Terriglobales bacterium]
MKFLCVLCVLCGFSLCSFALDREAFTFTNYDLTVRIEPEQQRLAVRGKITLRNDSARPQTNLALQISSSLDWRSVRVNGKAAHFVTQEYNSDIDHTGALSEAIVNPPEAIPPKGRIEVEVGYEGVIPLDTSRLTRIGVPEDKAKHTDWDQISNAFTAVRGIGYVVWYPVATEDASLSEGNSVAETIGRWQEREAPADFKTVLKYSRATGDPPPELLCSGIQTKEIYEQMGRAQLVSLDCDFSGAGLHVPTFTAANFQKLAANEAVGVHYLPQQESAAKDYAEVAAQIEPLSLGSSKPPSLQMIALPESDDQRFVTGSMLLTPLNSPMTNEAELSIVYAKARQLVPSPRAWIQDGLAHFAQAEFIEKQKGRPAAIEYLQSHATALITAEKDAPKMSVDQQSSHSLINAPDDLYLQTKAMYVWWMLRDTLGSLPVDALRDYRAAEDKEPTYLPGLIGKQTSRDLQWFFDDWVYHDRGLPDFRVASVFATPIQTGGFLVTINVENLGNAGAEVPLTLEFEGGEMRKRLEVHAKSTASLRMESPGVPQRVTVNDGSVPETDMTNNTYKIEVSKH